MRILVTGGAGFIGSALVRAIVARGDTAITFDAMTYAAHPRNLAGIPPERHVFIRGDIRQAGALRAALARYRPDAVMHLAAESHVDRSISGPGDFISTNIAGTATLLGEVLHYWQEGGHDPAFRFLHVSTDEVFGSLGPEGAFAEDTPYAPNSPYSASKAASDHLVRAWGRTYGLPVLITNCSNNYGPRQCAEKLIPRVIAHAAAGAAIPVYGDGTNCRDWLHVEDHVDALLAVLDRATPGSRYCIGGGTELSNIALVGRICDHLDARRPGNAPHARLISFVADRPGHDFRYAIDSARIARDLGWSPRRRFDVALGETVDWFLAHPDRLAPGMVDRGKAA
ncbi:MAG: dTDP-glucose 4,6-dehydratase [Rubricella sp.]